MTPMPPRRAAAAGRALRRAGATLAASLVLCLAVAGGCRDDVPPAPTDVLGQVLAAEAAVTYDGWRTVSEGPLATSRQTRVHVGRGPDRDAWVEWDRPDGSGRNWQARRRPPWAERPDLLRANYRIETIGGATRPIAWRETRGVRILPVREGRPSLEILADAATGLALAETRRDAAGNEVRNAVFESVEIGATGPGPAGEPVAPSVRPADGPGSWKPWRATWVPDGFARLRGETCSGGGWYEHWTDGLASITLAQMPESGPGTDAVAVRRRGGAVVLSTVRGEISVTLMGEATEAELTRMLAALRRD